MAGSRTLKLSILADVDDLNKKLKNATDDVETFGDKMGRVGKVVGAAFVAAAAAAGAYAVKIGVEGVKAALEDEKAQRILALTLTNTTAATKSQIDAVESYITKTSLATGVVDDQLRPAFSRLVRSTKDTEEAQKLLNTALDISSATGKPLEDIAAALGKAYDGNTNALGKLGLGIDQSIIKSKDFDKVFAALRENFAGFAANEANTFEGRIQRLKVAFDETKETIGFALLPIVQKLIDAFTIYVVPIFTKLEDALSPTGGLGESLNYISNVLSKVFIPVWNGLKSAFSSISEAIDNNKASFLAFGKLIADYVAPVVGTVLGGAIKGVGVVVSGVINLIGDVAEVVVKVVNGAISAVNALIKAYNAIPVLPNIPLIGAISAPNIAIPTSVSGTNIQVPSVPTIPVPTATATATKSATTPTAIQTGPTFSAVGATPFSQPLSLASQTPVNISPTINIGVAGDPQGVANTIVDVLKQSTARGAFATSRIFE